MVIFTLSGVATFYKFFGALSYGYEGCSS